MPGSTMSIPEDESTSREAAEKRQPRQSRLVKASLECSRLGRFDVMLRNISLKGIGGTAPHPLSEGERLTLHLPGHRAMKGTVRWASSTSFGIETDDPIEAAQLRAAHDGTLVTSDSKADFQIVPAPAVQPWRPGLRRTTTLPAYCRNRDPQG